MPRARVRVLPDEIANRIAAGEVVERPASVVKELVENSVDAGASRVAIRVGGAGKERIAVEDDGEGMGRDDALLALERHATSKVASTGDLEAISTLGFRGEAIPSIASVSRFRLLTRTEDDAEGTEVRVDGGKLLSARAAGAPRGTTVEVSDLFYNVPARRKFLKGDATELRNTVDTLTQLALVHFDVGFELTSGARRLLAVPAGQSLEERAGELVGSEAPGGLHWARVGSDDRHFVLGYAAPHEGRGHRRGIRLFVNGRPVQDRLLFRALLEGYRGVLESGRYPVALLWIDLPPQEVDVNVHPAKREVRFRDEGRIFRWVAGQTAGALARSPWAGGNGTRVEPPLEDPAPGLPAHTRADHRPEVYRVTEALGEVASRACGEVRSGPKAWAPSSQGPKMAHLSGSAGAPGRGSLEPSSAGAGLAQGRFGTLRYLGAFDATYLLFEDVEERALVVFDQHAAHERIVYEALLQQGEDAAARSQPLLFPVTLECSAAEMAAYGERVEDLEALGFRVEPFGPHTLALRSAPALLSPTAAEAAVRDLLGADDLYGSAVDLRERQEAAARRAACAAAVKARAVLLSSEVDELLGQLEGLRNPSHCPHGRPVLLRLSRKDLEGMFHRR